MMGPERRDRGPRPICTVYSVGRGGLSGTAQSFGLEPGLMNWPALHSNCSAKHGLFSKPLGEWGTLVTAPSHSLCGFVSAPETSLKSFALGTTEEGWEGTWLLASPLSRQRQDGHIPTALPLNCLPFPGCVMEWAAWH